MAIDVNRIDINSDFGTTGSTQCSFDVPLDAQPGDLWIVFCGAGCDPSGTPFEGHTAPVINGAGGTWVEIASVGVEYDPTGGGTGLISVIWWSKNLTPGATVTIDTGVDLSVFSVSAVRISGSATAPINAASAYGVGIDADPSIATVGSISPTVDDVLLLYFIAATHQSNSFQDCSPTGFVRAMYMQANLTTFESATLVAIKGADAGPTGAVASQPIDKDPVYLFNPRPLAIMLAVARGGCVDGTCPFVTTDGIASEG